MSLHQQIPNSCIIEQDSYFKVDCEAFIKFYLCILYILQNIWELGWSWGGSIFQDESVVPADSNGFQQYDSKGIVGKNSFSKYITSL